MNLDKSTRDILRKYGITQDNSVIDIDQDTVLENKNTVINSLTTNNISIQPPANIPQGRDVKVTETTIKLKDWISQSLERQSKTRAENRFRFNQEQSKLQRESRSIFRGLKDISQDFKDKYDSIKAASDRKKQIRSLIFLFGLHYLTKNWNNILKKVAELEKRFKDFLEWLGIGRRNTVSDPSGIQTVLIRIFGGTPGKESVLDSIKLLFIDKERGIFSLLKKEIKLIIDNRLDLIKLIPIPVLNSKYDILGIFKAIGIYLGDILTVLIGGNGAARDALGRTVARNDTSKMMEGKGWANRKSVGANGRTGAKVKDSSGNKLDSTSFGDAAIMMGYKDKKSGKIIRQNTLDWWDVDINGRLINNNKAGILQGRAITGMLDDFETGDVHTSEIMTGFENLKRSAEANGYVLVDQDFLSEISSKFGIQLPDLPPGSYADYKFIQDKKTYEDLSHEGVDVAGVVALQGAEDVLWDTHHEVYSLGAKLLKWGKAIDSGIRNAVAADNTLRMVPADDPRPGVSIEGQSTFRFTALKPEFIKNIELAIGNKLGYSDFKFDNMDDNSRTILDSYVISRTRQGIERELQNAPYYRQKALRNSLNRLHSEASDNTERLKQLGLLQEKYNQERASLDAAWGNSRAESAKVNVQSILSQITSGVNDFFDKSDYSGVSILGAIMGTDNYKVTSAFGSDRSWNRSKATKKAAADSGNPWPLLHKGVDLRAAIGTTIYAPFSGKVIKSSNSNEGTGGRSITIYSDDGVYKVYLCHLSNVLVNKGQHVEAGQIIGKSGASGHGTNTWYQPHLHVSVGFVDADTNEFTKLTGGWIDPRYLATGEVPLASYQRFNTTEPLTTKDIINLAAQNDPSVTQNTALQNHTARCIINDVILDANKIITDNWIVGSNIDTLKNIDTSNVFEGETTLTINGWRENPSKLYWSPREPIPRVIKYESSEYKPGEFIPKFKQEVNTALEDKLQALANIKNKWSQRAELKKKNTVARGMVASSFIVYNSLKK